MTRVKATEARQEFFRLLDAAEKGETVIVERKGARFRLSLIEAGPEPASTSPVQVNDPDVLSGNWSWVGAPDGQLQFRARRSRRKGR